REDADILLTVVQRGIGSQSYGQRTLYTQYFNNAVTMTVSVFANTYWVATVMQVGDYRKEFAAAYTNRAASSMGAWSADATQIANDIQAWIAANVTQLKNPERPTRPSEPRRNTDSPLSSGSGFFITNDGYLLTAAHVIGDGSQISVRMPTGELPATIVK